MGIDIVEAEKQGTTAEQYRHAQEQQKKRRVRMEQRVYVRRLSTNVKRQFDVELGPKVLLVGDNGAGKSSLVDSYSLVTTGEARSEGLGKGRDVASSGSCTAEKAKIEATMSNGDIISWPTEDASRATNVYMLAWKALYGDPKGLQALIMRAGTPRTGQGWVDAVREQLDQQVPAAFADEADRLFQSVVGRIGAQVGVTDAVGALIEETAREIRGLTAAASAVNTTRVEPLTETEESERARYALVAQIASNFDVAEKIVKLGIEASRVEATIASNQQEYEQQYERCQAGQSGTLRTQQSVLRGLLEAGERLLDYLKDRPDDKPLRCFCCGGATTTVAVRDQVRGRLSAAVAQVEQQLAEADEALEGLGVIARQIADGGRWLELYRAQLDQLRSVENVPLTPAAMANRYRELEARKAASGAAPAMQQVVATMGNRKQALEAIKQGLQRISAALAEAPLVLVGTRTNYLLPARIRVSIAMLGGRSGGCAIQVSVDGGAYHPFRLLGGAERATVAMAFSAALGDLGGDDPNGVRTAIIDEVWLRRRAAGDLLSLIDHAMENESGPSQVIVSVAEYDGAVPEGWTVVNLDQGDGLVASTPAAPGDAAPSDSDKRTKAEKNPKTPAPSGDPVELLGYLERPGRDSAPVYWLGVCHRFTQAAQLRLLSAPDRVEAMLGIALSGKDGSQLKTVTYSGGVVYPASCSPQDNLVLLQMALDRAKKSEETSSAATSPAEGAAEVAPPPLIM